MSTLILLFSLITQAPGAADVDATAKNDTPMRYHGVEMLLAKFEAQADQPTG